MAKGCLGGPAFPASHRWYDFHGHSVIATQTWRNPSVVAIGFYSSRLIPTLKNAIWTF